MTPEILILAAGSSSRMRGGDKLMEPVAGEPLLRRIARAALATGCPVTVVLPPDRPARPAALAGMALRQVVAARAGDGMAESLRAGVTALPVGRPILVLLADLPDITGADLTAFVRHWASLPDAILRGADSAGNPGHPVGFPADLRADLLGLTGDQGAREVIARHKPRLRLMPLPGRHATTDLDTPEDWATWRAAQPE